MRVKGTDREGNRPERTTYDVTGAGRSALRSRIAEILETPVREYPTFPIGLAEAHNLEPDEVVHLLENRIRLLDEDIAELEAMADFAGKLEVPRVFWVSIGYLRTVENAEVEWLRNLVAEIGSGKLPWLKSSTKRCLPEQTDDDG